MAVDNDLTNLLVDWCNGKPDTLDEIAPLVYDTLKLLARKQMAGERRDHTLNATALVNETFLKLADAKLVNPQGRAQFYGLAAKIMRNLLVDYAREKKSGKRGGEFRFVELDNGVLQMEAGGVDLELLNDAVNRLLVIHPRQGHLVELKYFVGLHEDEVASVLGVSLGTVQRDWRMAKAWLYRDLIKSPSRPH